MKGIDRQFIESKIKTIPIRQVCEMLRLDRKGKRYRCVNPSHPDNNPSMVAFFKTNTWKCFSCGEGGSVIDLVKFYHGCDYLQACLWLANQFCIQLPDNSNQRIRLQPKVKTPKTSTKSENIIIDHELLSWIISQGGLSRLACDFLFNERKLSSNVIDRCKVFSLNDKTKFISKLVENFGVARCIESRILYKDKQGILNTNYIFPALAFPFFDYEGRAVNIQTRSFFPTNPSERFRNIKGLPMIPFNLHSLKSLANGASVYIAEGVTDCLALLSEGYNAIAIPGANNYKEEFAQYIDRFVLIMFPDRDEPGTGLYDRMSKSLKCSVFRQEIPEDCKDYSDYHIKNHERH